MLSLLLDGFAVSGDSDSQSNQCADGSTNKRGWKPDFDHGEQSGWWIDPKTPDQPDEGAKQAKADQAEEGPLLWTERAARIGHTSSLGSLRRPRYPPAADRQGRAEVER